MSAIHIDSRRARKQWRPWIALAMLVGVAGGTVLAACWRGNRQRMHTVPDGAAGYVMVVGTSGRLPSRVPDRSTLALSDSCPDIGSRSR
jgi:hypothetical protein